MSEADVPGGPDPDEALAFEALRKLLVGEAAERVERVEQRLDQSEVRTEEVASVLPDAIIRESRKSDRLGAALAPTVEEALQVSIRRNPKALAEAVSPIMGPAIRRSIMQAIAGMVQSMNTAMEQSLTPQGLRWRIEALRTGRSFGEVVALRTLLYEVEQVFLIHKETALLLAHRSVREAKDADVVGSMLVAIRDFVKDSFQSGAGGGLDTIQVGDRTVWVETGRDTVLAVVIQGQAPSSIRPQLAEVLERIEMDYGQSLDAFDGDDAPFHSVSSDYLVECMLAQARDGGTKPTAKRSSAAGRLVWVGLGLIVLLVVASSLRDRFRWNRFVAELDAQPGIVVIDTDRRDGRRVARGLRDPLAIEPTAFLASTRLDSTEIGFDFQGYQSLEPEIVLERVRAITSPPDGVRLSLEGDALTVEGAAPADWLREIRGTIPAMAGVGSLSVAEPPAEVLALRALADSLRDQRVLFARGSAALPGGTDPLVPVRTALARADRLARVAGVPVLVAVVGSADPSGAPARNQQLAAARARAVLEALPAQAFPSLDFEVRAEPPPTSEIPDPERARSVRLVLTIPTG